MKELPAVVFFKDDYDLFQLLIAELPYCQARPLMDLIDGCVDRQVQACARLAQQTESEDGDAKVNAFDRWLFSETCSSTHNHFKKDGSQ